MNIQWTYNDFRTKGPIIQNVESWEVASAIDVNRGTYRDTWPIALPWSLPSATGVSSSQTPDDGVSVPAGATATWPPATWTGDAVPKVRVPDEMMHVVPRTRNEGVVYLKFYSGPFVDGTTATGVNIGVTSDITTDVLTKTAHGYKTGDIVKYVEGTNYAALTAGTLYYVIKLSSSTFQLATTLENAYAATAVNLITANGSAGVFMLMESASQPSGDVLGFVQLSEIVCWNVL